MGAAVTCPECGGPVVTDPNKSGGAPKIYCSHECRRDRWQRNNRDRVRVERAAYIERNRDHVRSYQRDRYHRPEVKAAQSARISRKRLERRQREAPRECAWCKGPLEVAVVLKHGKPSTFCSDDCRKADRKAYDQRWAVRNHERVKAAGARRRKERAAENKAYFQKHYAANRERKKRLHREWYAKHSERALATAREYAASHPELVRAIGRVSRATRRARIKDAFIETIDPHVVFNRDKGICGICHGDVDRRSKWEIDHVIPLSKGGAHAYANVQLAHHRCNRAKSAKMPEARIAC